MFNNNFESGFHNNVDTMFNFFPIIFGIIFFLIIGVFVVVIVKGLTQWNKNNNSPVLTVEAKVVAKRADVSHHTHHNTDSTGMHHTSSSTTYYVTFQVESGDRMELHVPNSEYGMLVEGDEGRLTFQGTRFKGFERAY